MDRSGGCEHSHSHSSDINGNWHGQHLEIIPELSDGSGTSSMHSETDPHVGNGSGSINQFDIKPKDIEGSRSTYPFETIPEVADRNERVSSSEDLFQVDTDHANFGSLNRPSEDEEIIVSTKKSTDSRASDTSICSNFTTQFSQVYGMPPTQSPPRQVMDRSGEYDPLRISSAVFERSKSSTPQEWSGTSTESLFSIQIGINSFSRDRFKSGELIKSEELIMFSPSTTITEVGADKEDDVFEKSDETPKGSTAEKNQKKAPPENVLQNPSGVSTFSEESSHSFAFPVKKKKKKMKKRCCTFGCVPLFCCRKKCKRKKCVWPSFYCSNCSCTFCYCSWPSCYFRWPSCYCSNCSWAFCYCWNCSLKRWCCHSSTTLTDKVKSPTGRPDVEEKKEKKPLAKEPGTQSHHLAAVGFLASFAVHAHVVHGLVLVLVSDVPPVVVLVLVSDVPPVAHVLVLLLVSAVPHVVHVLVLVLVSDVPPVVHCLVLVLVSVAPPAVHVLVLVSDVPPVVHGLVLVLVSVVPPVIHALVLVLVSAVPYVVAVDIVVENEN